MHRVELLDRPSEEWRVLDHGVIEMTGDGTDNDIGQEASLAVICREARAVPRTIDQFREPRVRFDEFPQSLVGQLAYRFDDLYKIESLSLLMLRDSTPHSYRGGLCDTQERLQVGPGRASRQQATQSSPGSGSMT